MLNEDTDTAAGQDAGDVSSQDADTAAGQDATSSQDAAPAPADATPAPAEAEASEYARLVESLREVHAKLASGEQRINELQAYKESKQQDAAVPELADDDFVSVKDMRSLVAKMLSESSKEDREFIAGMRTIEANRQRDDLLSKHPDAQSYVPQMQALSATNPNLSLEQLYILSSHKDEVLKARQANADRKGRASIVGKPSVSAAGKPGAAMSLEERLGAIWDQGAEARG